MPRSDAEYRLCSTWNTPQINNTQTQKETMKIESSRPLVPTREIWSFSVDMIEYIPHSTHICSFRFCQNVVTTRPVPRCSAQSIFLDQAHRFADRNGFCVLEKTLEALY